MKVMVELQNGVVRDFTDRMEIVGNNPLILFELDHDGNRIKLGKVRRIYTEGSK